MVGNAYSKLTTAGVDKIYVTNTIPADRVRIIDVSNVILEAIKKM